MFFLFKLITSVFENKIRSLESSNQLKDSLLLKLAHNDDKSSQSYAEAVKSSVNKKVTQHQTLLIKNKVSDDEAKPINVLKQSVDPVKDTIQISGLKVTNNAVFVSFTNESQMNTFRETVQSKCVSLVVETPRKKLSKILIRHVRPPTGDKDDLFRSICEQNSFNKETFRIIFSWQNKFNKNGSNTILEISQEDRLKVNKENNFIYLGFQRIAVKDIFCTQKCFN